MAKIEWHWGELCPRGGFMVTNSRLPSGKVTKVYNGQGDEENRIKEGKTPCLGTRPAANALKATRPG